MSGFEFAFSLVWPDEAENWAKYPDQPEPADGQLV